MRLLRALLVVIAVASSFAASAQQPPNNAAYFEIGGNGVIPSFNYERRFSNGVAGRVGVGWIESTSSSGQSDLTFAIPVMANFISRPERNHHLETGIGAVFVTGDAQDFGPDSDEQVSNVVPTALIGYRYQKPSRGFLFRAGFTPFYSDQFYAWGGVTFGWSW